MLRRLMLMLLLSVVLLAAGCAMFNKPDPPQIELVGLEVSDVSLSHANMLARLRLHNPNNFSLRIYGMRMKLDLNGVQMATGSSIGDIDVAPNGTGEMQVRLASPLWSFFNLANTLQKSHEVKFRLDGDIDLGGFGVLGRKLPIRREGIIPLDGIPTSYLPSQAK